MLQQIERWLIEPWTWWFSGIMITLVMYSLLYFGKSFGMSSNLRTLCSIGASNFSEFFRFDWKKEIWNLVVALGAMIGGYTFVHYINPNQKIDISDATIASLNEIGIAVEKGNVPLIPEQIFSWENLFTLQGFIFIVVGGFLVGFGTRYAGGCTSGHAISGLSNLQLPSLYAVLGFFAGGLIMVHFILPYLMLL